MDLHFETANLLLRPRTFEHFEACLRMDQDPQVTRFIPGEWDGGQWHRDFLQARISQDFGERCGYWAIFARQAPDELLGWVSFIPFDAVGPELEMGWRLVQRAWGRGFASEAARRIVEHAFADPQVERLVADAHVDNLASLAVARKIGFRVSHDADFEGLPSRFFEMTREDFLRQQASAGLSRA
ncbi:MULTISPECIES: GNAT family N-acetyltransferase [unclassified Pseudomonas]|uniref:GNAT family N-acetyltransferase n=1 Tax=unclassified Pseudomonas TaxID=196821 RepID=UPI000838E814|nr:MULTISPECIES: GNAT family N-acetyltransferase [unclassified Pseudomonas]QIH06757.1 GNAT family N-acetyltransferase [Pseudomonas sp. BIOMIG1BAC]